MAIAHLLFGVPFVDDQWRLAFAKLADSTPDWLEAGTTIVTRVYASDAAARDGYSRLALVCAARGMPDAALRLFEADLAGGRTGRWQFLRYLDTLLAEGRVGRAREVVEAYYETHPNAVDGWATIAAHLARRSDLAGAAQLYGRDLALGRLSGAGLSRCAEVEARLGRWDSAALVLSRQTAFGRLPTDAYARLGWIRFEQRDYTEAVTLFERDYALGQLSVHWKGRFSLALGASGAFDRAVAIVEECYGADPAAKNLYAALGWLKYDASDWAGAAAFMELDDRAGRLSAPWRYRFAQTAARSGDMSHAVELMADAYRQDAALRDGFGWLGWLLAEKHDWAGARAVMERDEAAGRLTPRWQFRLAQVVARTGDLSRAADLMAKAYEQDAAILDGFAQLAEVAAAAGRDDVAIELLERDAACGRLSASRLRELPRGLVRHGRVDEAVALIRDTAEQAGRVYPNLTAGDVRDALLSAGHVRDRIVGRAAGDIGDNLSQYGAIAQLARGGRRSIRFLEIGTLFGGSCLLMLHACRNLDVEPRGVCIDPMRGYYDQAEDKSRVPVTADTLFGNLRRFGFPADCVEVRQYESQAHEAWHGLREESFDILLIDGDHSFQGVTDDWRIYSRFVAPGGYVLFDDYGDKGWGDLTRAVSLICESLTADWHAAGVLGTTMVLRREPAADRTAGSRAA